MCTTGEYPMTGAQAAEKEVPGSKADMLHRGRNVALAFTMQVCFVLMLCCLWFKLPGMIFFNAISHVC